MKAQVLVQTECGQGGSRSVDPWLCEPSSANGCLDRRPGMRDVETEGGWFGEGCIAGL